MNDRDLRENAPQPPVLPPEPQRNVAVPRPASPRLDLRGVALPGGAPNVAIGVRPRAEPTSLDCLRCQLVGRRRLLCAKVDECKALPHSFVLGPLLLAAWAVTTIAFLVAVW